MKYCDSLLYFRNHGYQTKVLQKRLNDGKVNLVMVIVKQNVSWNCKTMKMRTTVVKITHLVVNFSGMWFAKIYWELHLLVTLKKLWFQKVILKATFLVFCHQTSQLQMYFSNFFRWDNDKLHQYRVGKSSRLTIWLEIFWRLNRKPQTVKNLTLRFETKIAKNLGEIDRFSSQFYVYQKLFDIL